MRSSVLSLLPVVAAADGPLVAITGLGTVQGRTSDSTQLFLGIPYAAAPVGELRWRAPQPHPRFGAVPFLATDFGPACPQVTAFDEVGPISEDCLTLNVARPAQTRSDALLPVLLWIHGGGNSEGRTSKAAYDLASLVEASEGSIVAVSIQYRLNVFGFLGSEEMQSDAADGSTGNFGLQDQRLAMQFVHDHIGAFGGHAAQVTLFGESAGAFDIAFHLTQPSSYHLFSKAILQSYGNSEVVTDVVPLDRADAQYRRFLNATGCAHLACLRSLDVDSLLAFAGGTWGPVADGRHTKASPAVFFASGEFHKVPVIIGSNREEMSILSHRAPPLLPGLPRNLTAKELDAIFPTLTIPGQPLIAEQVARVKQLYASEHYEYPRRRGLFNERWWMATRILTDVESTGFCTTRRFARGLAARTTVFAYHFEHPPQFTTNETLWSWFGPDNVCVPHGADIHYVFNSLPASATAADRHVGGRMVASWIAFATTADPSSEPRALEEWKEYRSSGGVLRIDSHGRQMQNDIRGAACDFWDSIWSRNKASADTIVV